MEQIPWLNDFYRCFSLPSTGCFFYNAPEQEPTWMELLRCHTQGILCRNYEYYIRMTCAITINNHHMESFIWQHYCRNSISVLDLICSCSSRIFLRKSQSFLQRLISFAWKTFRENFLQIVVFHNFHDYFQFKYLICGNSDYIPVTVTLFFLRWLKLVIVHWKA